MIPPAPVDLWERVIARLAQIIADRELGLPTPKVVPFREPAPKREGPA